MVLEEGDLIHGIPAIDGAVARRICAGAPTYDWELVYALTGQVNIERGMGADGDNAYVLTKKLVPINTYTWLSSSGAKGEALSWGDIIPTGIGSFLSASQEGHKIVGSTQYLAQSRMHLAFGTQVAVYFYSTDSGVSWNSSTVSVGGVQPTFLHSIWFSGSTIYVGGSTRGATYPAGTSIMYKSVNGGSTWTAIPSIVSGSNILTFASDSRYLYCYEFEFTNDYDPAKSGNWNFPCTPIAVSVFDMTTDTFIKQAAVPSMPTINMSTAPWSADGRILPGIAVNGNRELMVATTNKAEIMYSSDLGTSWNVMSIPVPAGETGIIGNAVGVGWHDTRRAYCVTHAEYISGFTFYGAICDGNKTSWSASVLGSAVDPYFYILGCGVAQGDGVSYALGGYNVYRRLH